MSRPPAKSVARSGATFVRRKPSLDFSLTGLVYSALMMFMGLAAINTQSNLLFVVFGLMVGVLLAAWFISRMMLRRLRIRRMIPDHMVVGRHALLTYEFANDKRLWPSLSVALGELDACEGFTKQPFTYLLHAAPGAAAVVPADVIPKRRGVHVLDRYQISTSFPFGFIKRAWIARQKDTLVVYPALGQVDEQLLSLCRSAEKSGPTVRPRRGGMDEFYGVKEFRTGENPRWIYWRRSAHTGILVAREMTQVSPPRLLLLVDTFLSDRSPEAHAVVERTIAMAASVASHALEAGLAVGLCAWSGQWVTIDAGRGKRHRRDLLTVLARLTLNQQQPMAALLSEGQRLLRTGTTPLLLTPRSMQPGLRDRAGGAVVIPAGSPEAEAWFRFDPGIDFAHCAPAEQQPQEPSQRPGRRWRTAA